MRVVDAATRVCPFCGRPPGEGVFCAACGRNLAQVERLPTAAEVARPLVARLEEATRGFLEAMHAAGDPGALEVPSGRPRVLRRTPRVTGWVVRPVDREDFQEPRRYEPGLLLTVQGAFHRLDSDLRGWGQRNFPHYELRASPEAIEPPADERLLDELAALRTAHLSGR